MIVEETDDMELIRSIVCHPEIYKTIIDDSCPPAEEFTPPLEGHEYLVGFTGDDAVGIMVYHWNNDKYYCHIQVLPEFRREHALNFARMALDIGLAKNLPIYAEIPCIYGNVVRFAEHFGFKCIEEKEDAHLQDGKLSNVKVLRLDHGIC
jgi:hypothetical protein